MTGENRKPVFMAPPGEAFIEGYRSTFIHPTLRRDSLEIKVTYNEVLNKVVTPIFEMLAALQHFPEAIEKLFYSLAFQFYKPANKELYAGIEWHSMNHLLWFRELGRFPVTVFFIKDPTCRAFALIGDMIAGKKVKLKPVQGATGVDIVLDHYQIEALRSRVVDAARTLQVYLYGSNISPKRPIELLIKEFRVPVTYDVIRSYEKDDVDFSRGTLIQRAEVARGGLTINVDEDKRFYVVCKVNGESWLLLIQKNGVLNVASFASIAEARQLFECPGMDKMNLESSISKPEGQSDLLMLMHPVVMEFDAYNSPLEKYIENAVPHKANIDTLPVPYYLIKMKSEFNRYQVLDLYKEM